MATGDTQDIVQGLKSALPRGWFSGDTPILDALLTGLAAAWSGLYSMAQYVKDQMRINTATGIWLDMIALDFFGTNLPRLANEQDTQYRARILAALIVEQGTRNAIYLALLRLTGRAPVIFEPARPADTGAYMASGSNTVLGLAYGATGGYGSTQMAYQALVTAYLPATAGIPYVAGYGLVPSPAPGTTYPAITANGAYTIPTRTEYALLANSQNNAELNSIYQAVNAAKPAGTIVWIGTSH